MTSKPKPTKASHYVNGILKDLNTLLATDAAGSLSSAARRTVAEVQVIIFLWRCENCDAYTCNLLHADLSRLSLNCQQKGGCRVNNQM